MNKRTISSLIKCFVLLILLLPTWLAWDVSPAQGATILVSRPDDPTPDTCLSGSDCSLREAIILANLTPTTLDQIYLPTNTYHIERSGNDDTSVLGDFDITSPIEIYGIEDTPSSVVRIEGDQLDRVFEVTGSNGDLWLERVTITEGYQPLYNGGGVACYHATLTLEDVVLVLNSSPAHYGGGLAADHCTVTISNTNITNNTASDGGGIFVNVSTQSLINSIVYYNHATSVGGGIYSINSDIDFYAVTLGANDAATRGGGVFQLGSDSSLLIDHSLVEGNHANTLEGGGLQISEGTNLTIVNSTISGNVADTFGGGISTSIPTTINHSTIVNNHADMNANNDGYGGGVFAYIGSVVTISNSILANNIDHSAFHYNDCAEYVGVDVISNGYNLVESGGNCTFISTGDLPGLDPMLGPLQNNGGWTNTHALLIGSPAIDAGDPSVTRILYPNSDQRGPARYARVVNGRVDIGAFEAWLVTFLPVVFR